MASERFALAGVLIALLLLAGCTGTPGAPQSIAAASNLFFENGQAYIQTTAYLNTPAELYASNVPGFNGLKLDSGAYANATGKVTILVSQNKRACVYSLSPRTGYVGGILGIGAIKVTEFYPANPTKDFSYDVSVNGANAATGLSPFNVGEVSINLPYNGVLAQTPVMKVAGLDALAGAQQCPAAGDFVIVQVANTIEAQSGNLVGAVRIYQQSIYNSNKNNLFGSNSGFLPLAYSTGGFDANANQYTLNSSNIGSAFVTVKVPLGAFNIATYRPPAAGQAQLVGSCVIQDAQVSQQTNLQFTYRNIGEASVFSYSLGSGKYVFVSGDMGSGTQVANSAERTVNLRVTPNNDASGSQVLPVTITGESGISTQIACIGTILQGSGDTTPLPTPQPGGTIPSTQCKFYEKAVTKTVGASSFLGFAWGGTQVGACAFDFMFVGGIVAVFGLLIVVLGLVMKAKGNDELGKWVAILGAFLLVVGVCSIAFQAVVEAAGSILIAGIGVGLIFVVLMALGGPTILKLAGW